MSKVVSADKIEIHSNDDEIKRHRDKYHLSLTDDVAENVHILGEPISPIQLTQSIFGRSTHPVKVSKLIRPPRGPGAGTPGGFLILP